MTKWQANVFTPVNKTSYNKHDNLMIGECMLQLKM